MSAEQYILGLDLGANSIGWAMLKSDGYKPIGVIKTGVRTFDAGVKGYGLGKEESHNVQRRNARQSRRQTERTANRLNDLFVVLQKAGLLPIDGVPLDSKLSRKEISQQKDWLLKKLDTELAVSWNEKLMARGEDEYRTQIKIHHNLLYLLRAAGLDEKLEPYEIGRALYHLAQRRGFERTNKKGKSEKQKEEEGKIAEETHFLQLEIEKANARTLGEYFVRLDPFADNSNKIRGRYTLRDMYKKEFNLIWDKQAAFYPEQLTPALKETIYHAIFFQRPLKSQKHLIGDCQFEPGHKRAPWASLQAQQFRMLQNINNTRIIMPDGSVRDLTSEERIALIARLENEGDLTITDAKKLLNLPHKTKINLEGGGETRLIGNRTAAAFHKILGDIWISWSDEQKQRLVAEVINCQENERGLPEKIIVEFNLDEKMALSLPKINLQPGYCNLSKKAIKKVLSLLENGTAYATAVKEIYGDRPKEPPRDMLPPVSDYDDDMRNLVVIRALTELRKVVNAIVKEYGKPEAIRIELARDMKKSRKQREETWKVSRRKEAERKKAADSFLKETDRAATSQDILKVMLAEEANWRCPYTGTPISFSTLGNFDIEHIIPFSRCLDNSYINKTLCLAEENRNMKSGKTPFEAYSGNTERWGEIIGRVKTFKCDKGMKQAKLQRFLMERSTDWEDFVSSQLNDTRYVSKIAMDYLGLLYGGVIDESGKRRIQAGRGGITAHLRNALNLNRVLGDGGKKERTDHRHHAIDAITIALTDHQIFKTLSEASKRAAAERRRLFGNIVEPWEGFLENVRQSIRELTVSHRVSHRIRGALHEETIYSKPIKASDGKEYVHVRKKVPSLTPSDIKNIVDERIKEIVINKLRDLGYNPEKLGESDIQKAFGSEERLPFLSATEKRTGQQRKIPIKKVRVRKSETVMPVGSGYAERYVTSGLNSHIEIFEETQKNAKTKWTGKTVSMFEAAQRLKKREPVINREQTDNRRFICSLALGDIIELEAEPEKKELFVIKTITVTRVGGKEYARIMYAPINEAKPKKLESSLLEPLKKLNCRKVIITPLGEVRQAND
ncbi:MAG: type II CRISPR RNA-guided endonuclease Cas9 [Nitrospirota bacterium]